jgi:hypothetical protein
MAVSDLKYTYLSTSSLLPFVKVGKWSNSPHGLLSRYGTYYGPDLYIIAFECNDATELEKQFIKHFTGYHITRELFEKTRELMVRYIEFFTKFSESVIIVNMGVNQDYHKYSLNLKREEEPPVVEEKAIAKHVKDSNRRILPAYTCPCCNFITKNKGDMRRHFHVKKPCPSLTGIILTDDIKKHVLSNRVYRANE